MLRSSMFRRALALPTLTLCAALVLATGCGGSDYDSGVPSGSGLPSSTGGGGGGGGGTSFRTVGIPSDGVDGSGQAVAITPFLFSAGPDEILFLVEDTAGTMDPATFAVTETDPATGAQANPGGSSLQLSSGFLLAVPNIPTSDRDYVITAQDTSGTTLTSNTIQATLPLVVGAGFDLTAPANQATGTGSNPTLTWDPDPAGAASYVPFVFGIAGIGSGTLSNDLPLVVEVAGSGTSLSVGSSGVADFANDPLVQVNGSDTAWAWAVFSLDGSG
ncbi:MAG: hypothetical protein ACYS22_18790, partial [Planctomycetota bacterium]